MVLTLQKTSKTLNALIWWNDVKNPKRLTRSENGVKNPKGLSLWNGQKPVRGCLAAKRCRKPKRPLGAKRFECKTPFEFDIAFGVFKPLRVCVWPFGVYIPLLSLYSLLAPLAVHIFAYVYMHPLMGFQRTGTCIPLWDFWSFRRRVKPYGFFIPFPGEWRRLGFSVCFAVMDTFSVLGIIRGI